VHLPAGQEEADRVAERVHQRVDLGAQSAARPPERLILAGFSWAPALC
jgi:predicted esterase